MKKNSLLFAKYRVGVLGGQFKGILGVIFPYIGLCLCLDNFGSMFHIPKCLF